MKASTLVALLPLAIGLSACGSAAYLHHQPSNGLTVRTAPPPPMVSDYFVVTTYPSRVDVSYPAESVHYAPNLNDPRN